MKQPPQHRAINSVPLLKAVLCADCESISESRNEVCGVCGGRSLVNLGRLLRSAMETESQLDVRDPMISRQLGTLLPKIHGVHSRIPSKGPHLAFQVFWRRRGVSGLDRPQRALQPPDHLRFLAAQISCDGSQS